MPEQRSSATASLTVIFTLETAGAREELHFDCANERGSGNRLQSRPSRILEGMESSVGELTAAGLLPPWNL